MSSSEARGRKGYLRYETGLVGHAGAEGTEQEEWGERRDGQRKNTNKGMGLWEVAEAAEPGFHPVGFFGSWWSIRLGPPPASRLLHNTTKMTD